MSDFETVPVGTLERLEQTEAERDALAAHVERLRKDSDWLLYCLAHDYRRLKKTTEAAFSTLQDTLIGTPATSLARMRDERAQAIQRAVKQARRDWAREDKAAIERRDLLKQAEALSEMIAAIPFSEELAREMLKHKRDELRRQAEEAPGPVSPDQEAP